ncbi:MAG: HsdR family type I site-specific deoxyribonuclease [Rhizobiales bacterium]|nr:HsdR family type I site-specific deoxyribonuclease [Hyphomicrobiales bacterium]
MSATNGPAVQDTEKHLSQLPALHLLQKMRPHWQLLNREQIDRERGGRRSGVFLNGILRESLARINRIELRGRVHAFTEGGLAEAIERLQRPRPSGLLRVNEELTNMMLLGTAVEQTVDGVTRASQLKFVDWTNPAANAFHASAEFEVEREHTAETCRPDIVLFVNGIPFAVIECKGPSIAVGEGVSQNIRNQQEGYIPSLFRTVQMLVATNKNDVRYGTVGTAAPFWSKWRELEDTDADLSAAINAPMTADENRNTFADGFAEDRAPYEARFADGDRLVTEQDRVLWALARPERILDIARRFTLFDAGEKKIARYQQFFSVRKILRRVISDRDEEGRRQGGVIWHTQGSGKSLTMVMLARALGLEPAIPDPRIVLVTDRIDLDEQLEGTFKACGLEPKRATTGRNLLELVANEKRAVVTTLINKFDTALNVRDFADESFDVFLLVDESHRGQYGRLHSRMRKVFPNACYLGFTGTPILKSEKNTAAKFGGIIDVYAIDQAVRDKAVVPLLYEGRHVEQRVDAVAIDAWFERVCAGLSEDQKADLKKKYARTARLFQTEQTIALIAFDVSAHFRQAWKGTGFKGQLVTPSKRSAILYKRALDELAVVTSEVIISPPDDREGEERIDEASSDEVKRFWKTMMERYGDEATYTSRIIEAFKKREDPEILIVVSKLLTGFDAPRNTVLYLARPLTEHNLLQAIARVNRVAEGKDYGYVVDYCSVLGELNQALTDYSALEGFDEADLAGTVISIKAETEKLGQRHSELWDVFRGVANTADEEALEQHLSDEARRDEFYDRLNAFARTLAIALSSHEFANDPANQRRITGYRNDLRRFENLRRAVGTRYQDAVDYGQYRKRIEKLLDTYVVADDVRPITDLINIFDEGAFAEVLRSKESAASRADTIAHATKRTIDERWEEDPTFFKRFSELIRQAIEDFRAKRISDLEYLKRVTDIRDQMIHRDTTALPEAVRDDALARAFFGCIHETIRGVDGAAPPKLDEISAEAAKHIVDIVHSHRRVDWSGNPDVENAIKNDIDDYVFDVLRGEHNVPVSTEAIDALIERLLMVARRQAA